LLQAIEVLGELQIKPYCAITHYILGELYTITGRSEKAIETLKKAEGMYQDRSLTCTIWRIRLSRYFTLLLV
jgi:hypothetical protein